MGPKYGDDEHRANRTLHCSLVAPCPVKIQNENDKRTTLICITIIHLPAFTTVKLWENKRDQWILMTTLNSHEKSSKMFEIIVAYGQQRKVKTNCLRTNCLRTNTLKNNNENPC